MELTIEEKNAAIALHSKANARGDLFQETLAKHYTDIFANAPKYAYPAVRCTPGELARKMTNGLAAGIANKDGNGIKRTCKDLRVVHTYKAIRAYLAGE